MDATGLREPFFDGDRRNFLIANFPIIGSTCVSNGAVTLLEVGTIICRLRVRNSYYP
jgi:hypothetical protein